MSAGTGIVGRPRTGVRFALDRVEGAEAETLYRGFAHLPDADVPIEVRVGDGGGEARAAAKTGEARAAEGRSRSDAELRELERVALALVRAAVKTGRAPRKIVRWRP